MLGHWQHVSEGCLLPLLVLLPPAAGFPAPPPLVLYRLPNMRYVAADSSDPASGASRWYYFQDAAILQDRVEEGLLGNLQELVGGRLRACCAAEDLALQCVEKQCIACLQALQLNPFCCAAPCRLSNGERCGPPWTRW